MTRRLTSKTRLDTLKRDCKRWLKALRLHDPAAVQRLERAWDKAPSQPSLRDVQHALAREYGFDGWPALKQALDDLTVAALSPAQQADIILRSAWDGGDPAAAARLALRHPDLARLSLPMAVVFGDLEEVRRRLRADPAAVSQKAGSLNWEPLLYLAYARLPLTAARENALAIGAALLEAGADPGVSFNDGWENPFTALTGVIGLGEGMRPPHPLAAEMADLLIGAGADPFDTQAVYNTSIAGDDVFWLDFLYDRSQAQGTAERWRTGPSKGLGGRLTLSAVDYLLGNAVASNHLNRARWLLDHGARAGGPNSYSKRSHLTEAHLRGFTDMARLLEEAGAAPVPLKPEEAFQAACFALDRPAAAALAQARPALLRQSGSLLAAADQGRADVAALLLDMGVSVDVENPRGVRALHQAASCDDVAVIRLLIDHGAQIDPREQTYGATPLGWAVHLGKREAADLLAPLSRDVFALASAGRVDRLTQVLEAQPDLANARRPKGDTPPLFHLPDDEAQAEAVAEVLLGRGADPAALGPDGVSAEKAARKRGLDAAADLIAARARGS